MKFLITGGAGFLGVALSNALVRQGAVVRVIDDESTGDRSRLDPAAHFTRGDVNDVPKLWSLLQGVDCVFHLAARVSVSESVLYPRDYNATNVGGAVALIQARINEVGSGKVSIWWQWAIPYVLLTIGEVMVSVTGLEFAYTQAPRKMKATVMGFWSLTVALGNVLVALLAGFKTMPLVKFFWLFAGLMVAAGLLFAVRAAFYVPKDYTQE